MNYRTVYADPPWPEKGGGKIKRGADRHYPLMTIRQIMDLRDMINRLANINSHLYLWVTNNYLPKGIEVMQWWGFRYVTKIEWFKGDPDTLELEGPGLGQYFRGITEPCLFGIRGMLPYKSIDGKRAQGKTGFFEHRRKHSQKPNTMRTMIEQVSYEPRIELFARNKTEGWDCWGNEVESDIKL